MSDVLDTVTSWAPRVVEARDSLDLSADTYPTWLVLALIHVESAGNPHAHRDGSQFWGLLQMGGPAASDVGIQDETRFDGDGYLSILACLEYLDRYSRRHAGVPDRIAALWKGGPGTAEMIRDLLASGRALDTAIEQAAIAKGVPRLPEYVRRFRAAVDAYRPWWDERGDDDPNQCLAPSDGDVI